MSYCVPWLHAYSSGQFVTSELGFVRSMGGGGGGLWVWLSDSKTCLRNDLLYPEVYLHQWVFDKPAPDCQTVLDFAGTRDDDENRISIALHGRNFRWRRLW